MTTTTVGVKLDEATRERLKQAAQALDRTPHWVVKQAIFNYLEQHEAGQTPAVAGTADDPMSAAAAEESTHQYFLDFAEGVLPQSVLRAAITSAYRRPEPEMLPLLVEQARLTQKIGRQTHELAYRLTDELRHGKGAGGRAGLVQGLLQEFSLSSQEGVALMCLAEALLRIPDKGTRDALIRDKIAKGKWRDHLGKSTSVFVNAASWGLLLTGKLVATHNEEKMAGTLNRLIGRSGEPVIRKGVDMAMRMMGEQFVTGETISEALANAGRFEARGFRYSYDMLGEAALTAADAERYLASYEQSIHAIGKASNGRGIYEGPGISIKLSALHPRYSRFQHARVMQELYPRLLQLCLLARNYDIGINIDAEEADRLELSLDLLELLCFEPELAGWNGIGFVIQAYQKRCPFVIDYLIDLAQRSQHRLMIRLVKGAYWDSEIKRAQVDGLEDYPVYTRKVYTDVSYIACARKLLSAPQAVYPQFATHNAYTLAAIYHLAGQNYYPGQYEFQCLHGMGEPLYEQVVGKLADGRLNRPCRVYAPVGSHETLLAYLVRRLLENGANTSFVNRIADHSIAIEELVADPLQQAETLAAQEGRLGLTHPRIPQPSELYGPSRSNSSGLDLSNEHRLASLSTALLSSAARDWRAAPILGCPAQGGELAPVRNPADHQDVVGQVQPASLQDVVQAVQASLAAAPIWQATPPKERAAVLDNAAMLLEAQMQPLLGLLVREAGKTYANAIAEVREAVDFLRYYAMQVREHFDNASHRPRGPLVCISPWNFPLAIFTGQIAAALAAGNTVLAKPAEQTPLVAAEAVRLLLEAGVPEGALQLLPGAGETVGAALVGDEGIRGVIFTGSTEVAQIIHQNLAGRLDALGRPLPLIAETGGQNAMLVDSSALLEQVVADILASAFDSAGQRCSALRVLCVQEDVAERLLNMLKGAMAEQRLGNPEYLATDIGPVIDGAAQEAIEAHIARLAEQGRKVHRLARSQAAQTRQGTFVTPTLIELDSLDDLQREVFGPVLHVLRYRRKDLGQLLQRINATGYGLTMGLHTRIDETIAKVVAAAQVGNLYVNRNMVGAVVGVQPFGGEGLSGTGPKAGGPLYLYRLLATCPEDAPGLALDRTEPDQTLKTRLQQPLQDLLQWAKASGRENLTEAATRFARLAQGGTTRLLPGPTGERNSYSLLPRQAVLCLADEPEDRLLQLAAVLAVGSRALLPGSPGLPLLDELPASVRARIDLVGDWQRDSQPFDALLHHGDSDQLREICRQVGRTRGPHSRSHRPVPRR